MPKIKREVFNDVTCKGYKRRNFSNDTLLRIRSKARQKFFQKHPNIVEELTQVHGSKYDYSEVEYIDRTTPLRIFCPEHGLFLRTFYSHLNGAGCPKCTLEYLKSKRLHSTDRVIRKFREVHGDKYDYSRVSYVRNDQKVTIVCRQHGVFLQTPHHHKNGNTCPECALQDRASRMRDALETVISKFRSVHGDLYNYDSVVYENSRTKISIECLEHGIFQQTPSNHIQGTGCPACWKKNRKNRP